jgi:NAD(P)-dependent dehydrogenase (short-subunit alcohol dehydrogenase family)
MSSLSGRVAVVTGASRGVGKGISLALGEAGATVYVTGRSDADGTNEVGYRQGKRGCLDRRYNRQLRSCLFRVTGGHPHEKKSIWRLARQ